jgi:hypothetical protein
MKYVRVAAVGILAVLLGTCEALLSTVGRLKTANPALPREIKRSTSVKQHASTFSNTVAKQLNPMSITQHP